MINKQLITIKSEAWTNERNTHRYVLRREWLEGIEDKKGDLAAVITIRPSSTSPYTEDLTMMLIEKHVRQLGFSGFIAVNLFSSIEAKDRASFLKGVDDQTLEVFTTVLAEKRISQIIFAVGSIVKTNSVAMDQAEKCYDLLTPKQKKMTQVLINSKGAIAHPLSVQVRKAWNLENAKLLFSKKKMEK